MTVEFKGESDPNNNSFWKDSIKDYRGRAMIQSQMKCNTPPSGEWNEIRSLLHQTFIGIKKVKPPQILQYNKITGKKITFKQHKGKIEGEMFDFKNDDLPF